MPKRRITKTQINEMVRLHRQEGLKYEEIGRRVGVHRQTVAKYVTEAMVASAEETVRQSALRDELAKHWDALREVARRLPERFSVPSAELESSPTRAEFDPVKLDLEKRLLIGALREHTREDALWRAVAQWNEAVRDLNRIVETLPAGDSPRNNGNIAAAIDKMSECHLQIVEATTVLHLRGISAGTCRLCPF